QPPERENGGRSAGQAAAQRLPQIPGGGGQFGQDEICGDGTPAGSRPRAGRFCHELAEDRDMSLLERTVESPMEGPRAPAVAVVLAEEIRHLEASRMDDHGIGSMDEPPSRPGPTRADLPILGVAERLVEASELAERIRREGDVARRKEPDRRR